MNQTHGAGTVLVLTALYLLLFGAFGAEVSFVPDVLSTAGLSAGQIGAVLSIGTISQVLIAPMAGLIADRFGPKPVLFVATSIAAVALALLSLSSGRVDTAMLVYVLFAMAAAPLNPLADTVAVPVCRHMDLAYGRLRGVGSVGFLGGILLSSALAARLGATSTILTSAAMFALLIPVLPFLPTMVRPADSAPTAGSVRMLLTNRAYHRVLVVAAAVIGSHAMSDAFAVIYWRGNGIAVETIGLLLALAVVSELVLFTTIGPALIARLGASTCAVVGAILGGAGWVIMAESHTLWSAILTQLLHGFAFALVHLACMQALANIVPKQAFGLAQGLYGICSNSVASAIVTLAAGALYGTLHGHVFLLAAGLCFLSLPLALGWNADTVRAGGAATAAEFE